MNELLQQVVPILYLLSAVLFIVGLKGLTKVRTAQSQTELDRQIHNGKRWFTAGDAAKAWIGEATVLRDDFAPVDQLMSRS